VVASRWIAAYLYDVGATDLPTYASTFTIVVAASGAAALAATRKLGRTDLAATLKEA
jgi:hypothetical protein